jgi:hydroxymethylpyrimidine pyrophosphatase-like HAD family hydrolase
VSDAQKEKIKGEVKEVMSTIIKGVEEANFDMFTGNYLDSPDFVFLYNGNPFNYQQFSDLAKTILSTLINAKCTIVDEKYMVFDNFNVLYTGNSKWQMNYKDGHAILDDPWALQYMFKKVDNKWKVISANESGIEKSAKNTETSKELNQVELMKQMIGSWKCDIAKDTTFFAECKSYGTTGLEWTYKNVTKGKIVKEGKQFWGYDKKVDILIFSSMDKGGDIGMYASWFLSKNKYIYLPYSDISNPETASFKIEGEIKSPDIVIETTIVNNKPVITYTYTRVK